MVTRKLAVVACVVLVGAACGGKKGQQIGDHDDDDADFDVLPPGSPVADAGADQEVAPYSLVLLNGTGSSDPEGASLTYAWQQISGPAVELTNAGSAAPTFMAPAEGTLVFSLIVDDGELSSNADTVSVAVVQYDGTERPPVEGGSTFSGGGTITGFTEPLAIAMEGNTLYVADGTDGLRIFDVTDAGAPVARGTLDFPMSAIAVDTARLVGIAAGTTSGASAVHLVDVANADAPVLAGTIDGGYIEDLAGDDTVTYVATRRALIAIDTISSSPVQKVFSLEGGASGMHLVGNRLYTVGTAGGFQIFDVSDRLNPVRLYGPQVGGSFDRLIRVSGTRAYITTIVGGVRVVDVTDPASPVQMGSTTLGDPERMEVVGTTVYVANGSNGLAIVDASNGNSPSVVGSYDPGATTSDVAVIGTLAVIANSGSSLIIDVSDPAAPAPVGEALESSEVAQRVGDYVLMESGLVLDIADPNDVQTVGTVAFSSQPWFARAGGSRVVAVVGVNVIDVVDVTSPASPSLAHTLPTIPGMISASLKGSRLFVTYDEPDDGVAVFDLTTFAAPRPLKLLSYSSAQRVHACNPGLALVETFNSVGPLRTDALTSAAGLGSSPDAVACHGTLAVVLESSPRVYDLSGAGAPTSTTLGGLGNGEDGLDVAMDATHIYMAIDDSGLADGGFAAATMTGNVGETVYKRGLTDDPTAVAGSGNRAAVLFGNDVLVYDVPSDIGLDMLGTHALTVVDTVAAADGELVAVRTTTALQIYGADQPQAAPLGSVSLPFGVVKLASAGQLVFAVVATPAPERVVVVDVSAPATPNAVGTYEATGITAITATGTRLLVARGGVVDVVDVTNPAAPSKLGEYDSDVSSVTMMRASENLFVVRMPGGAEVVDMTNGAAPSRVGTVNNSNSTPVDMDLDGTALTLGSGFGVDLWDLQTPASPDHLGRLQTSIQNVARVGNLVAALEVAYTEGNWAYHGILVDVSFPSAPARVASFDVPLIPTSLVAANSSLWFGTTTGLRVFPIARDAVRFDDLRTVAGLGTTVSYTATFTDFDSNRGERAQCIVTSGTCEVTSFDPVARTVGVSWMVGAVAGQADIALVVGNDQWFAAAYDFITVQ